MKDNIKFVIMDLMNASQFKDIRKLEALCLKADKTTLKLELDYKESLAREAGVLDKDVQGDEEPTGGHRNDFMCYAGKDLVGYLGICGFGGMVLEVNGMVHPDYRLMGIFSRLMDFVMTEFSRRDETGIQFLCDSDSKSGQSFISTTGAIYQFSEYEMDFNMKKKSTLTQSPDLTFIKADNSHGQVIANQNAIYFGLPLDQIDVPLPETEAARGMDMYLIALKDEIVGKVNIYMKNKEAGIYGLGIMPKYRGRGFGRQGLIFAIMNALDKQADKIILQVEAENQKALSLYLDAGFEIESKMDYYDGRSAN